MRTRSYSFPEQQSFNPYRKPTWRWDRACDLVDSGQYFSKVRDDRATGIAVDFIRETNRCLSNLRLRRVTKRYRYIAQAKEIWDARTATRLEIESRILARQNDAEVSLALDLPGETIQAYNHVFFDVRGRIDATAYILWEVVAVRPRVAYSAIQLMQLSAYHHGPHVVGPWLRYLRDEFDGTNLASADGRLAASISLLVATHSLDGEDHTQKSLVKRSPFLLKNERNFARSVSAARAFRASTEAITKTLDLPSAEVEAHSYAPTGKTDANRASAQEDRKVA